MLDRNDQARDIAEWILSLPCYVRLPLQLQQDFEKTGATPPIPDDLRAGGRIYCRGKGHRAALECRQSLPALPRETRWCGVYTTNFSRTGCGFLHGEILYPGERMRLVLLTGVPRMVEVVRCRRLADECFEVGVRFIAAGDSPKV